MRSPEVRVINYESLHLLVFYYRNELAGGLPRGEYHHICPDSVSRLPRDIHERKWQVFYNRSLLSIEAVLVRALSTSASGTLYHRSRFCH